MTKFQKVYRGAFPKREAISLANAVMTGNQFDLTGILDTSVRKAKRKNLYEIWWEYEQV